MRIPKISLAVFGLCVAAAFISSGCQQSNENQNATATSSVTPPPTQNLSVVSRPEKIEQMMKDRGEQDQAKPTLRIISPAKNATINGSTVEVKLELTGDLKGYKPHKDPATGKGNHIHVILDNQPYEAYYELDQPFQLLNLSEGEHTLRVFPSRPWHESFKNDGAFQMVTFIVKGGGEASKPTTTNSGQIMASPTKSPAKPGTSKSETAGASPTPAREGKDFSATKITNLGPVDLAKPLLTYSRPKGDYSGDDADPIMLDFWLLNARLRDQGGEYRVRYTIDGQTGFLDKWEPIWLTGWTNGPHTVKLELIDKDGNVVDNGGGYNSTTRDITVTKK